MFKIGDFAKLNRVTVTTLRHYDRLGLLQPERVDGFTGYRYYSAGQMPRFNRILALKDAGFALEEIALILDKDLDPGQMQTLLELKAVELDKRIRLEEERLSRVRNLIKIWKQEAFNMNYDVVIKSIEPVRAATLRDIIPNYSQQGHLWHELTAHIEKYGAKIVPPCMVMYHNTGHTESSVDAEVIELIQGDLPETDRIKVKMLEGAKEMASVVHKGPFETLYLAYNAISKWIEDNGYEIIGSQRELYLKGDWLTDDPNEYITEMQFPVRKIKG